MRGLLACALLTACYREPSDSCGVAGSCAPDGPPPIQTCSTLPTQLTKDQTITGGSWLAAEFGDDPFAIISFKMDGMHDSILGTKEDLLAGAATFLPVASGDETREFRSPRLAVGGHELFVRVDEQMETVNFIASMARAGGDDQWAAFMPLDLRDQDDTPFTILLGADASVPTLTAPRRMLLVYGLTAGFDEFEEDTARNLWKRVLHHTAVYTPPFTGQAHLSADGKRLIYVSLNVPLDQSTISVVERQSLDTEFDVTGTTLPVEATRPERPTLSADCSHLFYDDEGGSVHVVTY